MKHREAGFGFELFRVSSWIGFHPGHQQSRLLNPFFSSLLIIHPEQFRRTLEDAIKMEVIS